MIEYYPIATLPNISWLLDVDNRVVTIFYLENHLTSCEKWIECSSSHSICGSVVEYMLQRARLTCKLEFDSTSTLDQYLISVGFSRALLFQVPGGSINIYKRQIWRTGIVK